MNKILITLCALILCIFSYQLARLESEPATNIDIDRIEAHARILNRRPHLKVIRFFDHYSCPGFNYFLIGKYLNAAKRYQIPYNLLPAISIQESTCGKHFPVHTANLWGWNSAKSGFADLPQGIDFVSERLANGHYYANKSTTKKLNAYNPNPEYAPRVERFMAEIENQ